jgi:hypothetical protein
MKYSSTKPEQCPPPFSNMLCMQHDDNLQTFVVHIHQKEAQNHLIHLFDHFHVNWDETQTLPNSIRFKKKEWANEYAYSSFRKR